MNVGEWLASLRADREMTQEQLSAKSGVPRSTIANIEIGFRKIKAEQAMALARVLNVEWPLFFERPCVNRNKAS